MIGRAIEEAFIALVVIVAVCSALLTVAVIYGVPWIWSLVKPWLHLVTA